MLLSGRTCLHLAAQLLDEEAGEEDLGFATVSLRRPVPRRAIALTNDDGVEVLSVELEARPLERQAPAPVADVSGASADSTMGSCVTACHIVSDNVLRPALLYHPPRCARHRTPLSSESSVISAS